MKKKLDTRFPAVSTLLVVPLSLEVVRLWFLFLKARIKKIMQADEDVGKIAMAVPLLVCMKQCVQRFNVFDFLKDTVSKVPDLGGSDAATEDKCATRRRKISDGEDGNSDECKRIRMHETGDATSNGRGRGRGRVEVVAEQDENQKEDHIGLDNVAGAADSRATGRKDEDESVRNFDLNVELNENGDSTSTLVGPPSESSMKPAAGLKHEDIPGWSLDDMKRLAVDPVQLASFNVGVEDEDYDEE
ncbi:UNVERIFIED_CONTAM: Dr1-associated corepressor [Sesamum calycinum]|uniref:Dr1-associated corepressor n=1 Tax=Sesamum calycinum TaxID=2727403 RepID=A0AAW2ITG0_9LAMI